MFKKRSQDEFDEFRQAIFDTKTRHSHDSIVDAIAAGVAAAPSQTSPPRQGRLGGKWSRFRARREVPAVLLGGPPCRECRVGVG